MLIPTVDPIGSLFVVVGVFIYYALKGDGKKKPVATLPVKPKTKEDEWAEEMEKRERIVYLMKEGVIKKWSRDDYIRYILWLYMHQDGVKLPTSEDR